MNTLLWIGAGLLGLAVLYLAAYVIGRGHSDGKADSIRSVVKKLRNKEDGPWRQ